MGEEREKPVTQQLDEKMDDVLIFAMEKGIHPVYLIGVLTTIATGIATDIRDQAQAKAGAKDGQ